MHNDGLNKEYNLRLRLESLLEANGDYEYIEQLGHSRLTFYDSTDLATILMVAGLVFKEEK